MFVARTIGALQAALAPARSAGRTVGFCPTMGALHDGHLSLVRRSRAGNDVTVASVFVNPRQFGPTEDLDRYPRTEARDLEVLDGAGCDVVFVPTAAELYPDGFATTVTVEGPSEHLCGARRPGHFAGVATVVLKLFVLVRPTRAYFGMKDAQQYFVIDRMVRDLCLPVELVPCQTVREADGLAMSSRNGNLTADHRRQAPAIARGLQSAREAFAAGERAADTLVGAVTGALADCPGAEVDYVQVVSVPAMRPVAVAGDRALLACAVRFGAVRLIDNVMLEREEAACS